LPCCFLLLLDVFTEIAAVMMVMMMMMMMMMMMVMMVMVVLCPAGCPLCSCG